jgi:hypothetical protein
MRLDLGTKVGLREDLRVGLLGSLWVSLRDRLRYNLWDSLWDGLQGSMLRRITEMLRRYG